MFSQIWQRQISARGGYKTLLIVKIWPETLAINAKLNLDNPERRIVLHREGGRQEEFFDYIDDKKCTFFISGVDEKDEMKMLNILRTTDDMGWVWGRWVHIDSVQRVLLDDSDVHNT